MSPAAGGVTPPVGGAARRVVGQRFLSVTSLLVGCVLGVLIIEGGGWAADLLSSPGAALNRAALGPPTVGRCKLDPGLKQAWFQKVQR